MCCSDHFPNMIHLRVQVLPSCPLLNLSKAIMQNLQEGGQEYMNQTLHKISSWYLLSIDRK